VTSTQIYASQGGCEVVTYRVGRFRGAGRSSWPAFWWFPGHSRFRRRQTGPVCPIRRSLSHDAFRRPVVAEDAPGTRPRRLSSTNFSRIRSGRIALKSRMPSSTRSSRRYCPKRPNHGPRQSLENYPGYQQGIASEKQRDIKSLAQKSKPESCGNSPFFMMPNGKVMAAFADRRTYLYQGRVIDHPGSPWIRSGSHQAVSRSRSQQRDRCLCGILRHLRQCRSY